LTQPEGPAALSEEPARPSLVRSGLKTYGANVAGAALGLVNVLVMARALGPAGRGDVVFLTTIAFLVSWLASLGIDQAAVNIAGRERKLSPLVATNAIAFGLALGVAGAAFVALLVGLVPEVGGEADPALRWLILASLPMLVVQIYLRQIAAASYGFLVINVGYWLPPVVNVTVNGALALAGKLTVTAAILAWVGGQAVSTAVSVWYVLRRGDGFGRPDRALGGRMLTFGLKAHAGRVMLIGNYRVDQWILGAVSGSRELGLYSVAVAWSETLFFLPNALAAVQRPDLVRADRDEAARTAATVFRAVTLLTLAGAVGLIVLAPVLCTELFGERFAGSVDDLRVLAIGAVGIGGLKLLGSALTARDRPLLESAAAGVAFITIIALDVVLIPPLGGLGAAIASTLAYSAGGVTVAVLFARALGYPARELVPRPSDLSVLVARLRRA
jgi:O-antigen/teichoic acid export membrane protein